MLEIHYYQGTLEIKGETSDLLENLNWLQFDSRSRSFRCHAYHYRALIRLFIQNNISYSDFTPKYQQLDLKMKSDLAPRDYQQEALLKWSHSKRASVILPTGSGKSFLAALALIQVQRSTLIVVPTIDLLNQWHSNLSDILSDPVGMVGGGTYEIQEVTVMTYDSARIHANQLGNRFCLLVFDECHHLPSPAYTEMARAFIAPYRLGLTATPPEEEEKQLILSDVCGPVAYQKEITELAGDFLAPYRVVSMIVKLTDEEQNEYDFHREVYLRFKNSLPGYVTGGNWEKFVMAASRTQEGRNALKSFAVQKQLSIAAGEKMNKLFEILQTHRNDKILIFTHDNKTAYKISSLFLLPLITHETKAAERKGILENFRNGIWPFLVSSRVLNEGVDVPEANVAVVISGTGTVREHVQRLGRVLRKKEDKQAVLYEMITENTGEIYTSRKRREHGAYQRFQ